MATPLQVKAKTAWKSVNIPQDLLNNEDFSGLVDIQVLTDYDLVQSNEEPVKKRKRKRENDVPDDDSEKKPTLNDNTDLMPGRKKKKKNKKNKLEEDVALNKLDQVDEKQKPLHVASKTLLTDSKSKKTKIGATKQSGKVVTVDTLCDAVPSSIFSEESEGDQAESVKKKKKKTKKKRKTNPDNLQSIAASQDDTSNVSSGADMSEWDNLCVPDVLLQALQDRGFTQPTVIQRLVLPAAIREKKDILGAAETGSGKTLAFGIPVLAKILSESKRRKQEDDDEELSEDSEDSNSEGSGASKSGCEHPMAVILEPTRELAVQVKNHLTALAAHTDIKFVTVVGGMAVEKQRRILSKHPHVIIATPGRLWQLIDEGNPYLRRLSRVYSLVVDEADRMVEKGHFEELTKIMELLNGSVDHRKTRQTFVMSATLTMDVAAPKRLLNKQKKKPKQEDKLKMLTANICLGLKPKVVDLTPKDKVAQTLTELRVNCKATEKDMYLYYFLRQHPGRTLVFVNSKDCLRRLVSVFTLLQCTPLPLHADMHQRQRLKNLDRFTEKNSSLLLASDVAARGLDIPKVDHVIHYQVPRTMENYVHRSGRTARASQQGLSVMFVGPDEAKDYRKIVQGVKNGEELPILPLEQDLLPTAKHRVDLAQTIDVTEHRMKKKKVRNNFFLKAAEEMDMIVDDANLLQEEGDAMDQSRDRQRLAQLKHQLAGVAGAALAPFRRSKYPTKSGQLTSQRVVNLFGAT